MWPAPKPHKPVEAPAKTRLRLRVTASDGIHSMSRLSPVFSLPEHAPLAAITSIAQGKRYQVGEPVSLRGLAYDLEEGLLDGRDKRGSGFTWYLDEREIPEKWIHRLLRPGPHTLKLKVTDSTGKTGTDSVFFFVEPEKKKEFRANIMTGKTVPKSSK